jgi:hypothetical protein
LLDKEGVAVLPLIFVDGEVFLKGRYLTDPERGRFPAQRSVSAEVASETSALSTRSRKHDATCFHAGWRGQSVAVLRDGVGWRNPADACCW